MHLIKDENGNLCPHSHEHTHEHHGHDHTHHDYENAGCGQCGGCSAQEGEGGEKKEIIALLTYMLQHNEHHAAELDQMAQRLKQSGMDTAADQISKGVSEFQKANLHLSVALSMVKEDQ